MNRRRRRSRCCLQRVMHGRRALLSSGRAAGRDSPALLLAVRFTSRRWLLMRGLTSRGS